MALAADHDEDGRIVELRLYFSTWPLTGRHVNRPPLLQPDLGLRGPDVVGEPLYELFFSNGAGIPLEQCAVTDDGRACALEYNLVAWGRTELPPEAGLAIYVRGDSGKLAAARLHDDAEPPLSAHVQRPATG